MWNWVEVIKSEVVICKIEECRTDFNANVISIQSKHFTLRYDQSIYVVSLNLNLLLWNAAYIIPFSAHASFSDFLFSSISLVVPRNVRWIILQHNERKFFIWRYHNLVHARADFDECDLFVRMQRLYCHLSFVRELSNKRTVINGFLLVHGRLNRYALLVDDYHAKHTHVSVYSVEGFLHFLRWSHAYSQL